MVTMMNCVGVYVQEKQLCMTKLFEVCKVDPGTVDLGLNKMWTSAVHTFRRTPDPFLWNCLIVLTGKSCKILVIPIDLGHDLLMLCFPSHE